MVRSRAARQKMQSVYCLRPGQTLENTRVSDRPLALIAAKSVFDRFVGHVTEADRLAARKAEDSARIAAIKKATYEMSKNWDNTVENIKRRQREELLSKKQQAEAERMRFVEETAAKNAEERAKVVGQARRLLLYRRPGCRRINRALMNAECYRELDAQVAFRKTLKRVDEIEEQEYANFIAEEAARCEAEKRREVEERSKKVKEYAIELKKQIEEAKSSGRRQDEEELEAEKSDQRNMTKELELIRQCELQQITEEKTKLRKIFVEAIEEKKRNELRLKRDEDFEDRALEVYKRAKERIRKLHKSVVEKEKESRARRVQATGEAYGAIEDTRIAEDAIFEKAAKEKAEIEERQRKEKEDRERTMRAIMDNYRREMVVAKEKQSCEAKELRAWEMLQRFKRADFDRKFDEDEKRREWNKKTEYAKILHEDMIEKEAERKREKLLDEKITDTTADIEKADRRILDYANEVLEESKGVRPLFPILKAIEECKKEMGHAMPKKVKQCGECSTRKPKSKCGVKRACACSPREDQVCYLK